MNIALDGGLPNTLGIRILDESKGVHGWRITSLYERLARGCEGEGWHSLIALRASLCPALRGSTRRPVFVWTVRFACATARERAL